MWKRSDEDLVIHHQIDRFPESGQLVFERRSQVIERLARGITTVNEIQIPRLYRAPTFERLEVEDVIPLLGAEKDHWHAAGAPGLY